jgi:hypothetical protein
VQLPAEIRRDPENGVHLSGFKSLDSLVDIRHIHRLKIFRPIHKIHHLPGFRGIILQHHRNGRILYVQADAKADDQNQDNGQQNSHHQTALVPAHFQKFFMGQSPHPAQPVIDGVLHGSPPPLLPVPGGQYR